MGFRNGEPIGRLRSGLCADPCSVNCPCPSLSAPPLRPWGIGMRIETRLQHHSMPFSVFLWLSGADRAFDFGGQHLEVPG